jgi:hypothetical protein
MWFVCEVLMFSVLEHLDVGHLHFVIFYGSSQIVKDIFEAQIAVLQGFPLVLSEAVPVIFVVEHQTAETVCLTNNIVYFLYLS